MKCSLFVVGVFLMEGATADDASAAVAWADLMEGAKVYDPSAAVAWADKCCDGSCSTCKCGNGEGTGCSPFSGSSTCQCAEFTSHSLCHGGMFQYSWGGTCNPGTDSYATWKGYNLRLAGDLWRALTEKKGWKKKTKASKGDVLIFGNDQHACIARSHSTVDCHNNNHCGASISGIASGFAGVYKIFGPPPSPSPPPPSPPSPLPSTSITITTVADPDNNHCIDLPGGDTANGNAIWLWECNGQRSQDWVFDADSWSIHYASDLTKCVDIQDGQIGSGASLQIWDCLGLPQQTFGYDSDLNTIYAASSASSGDASLCVDLPGGDYYNGAKLWLWDCNGGTNQAWYIWGVAGANGEAASSNLTIVA